MPFINFMTIFNILKLVIVFSKVKMANFAHWIANEEGLGLV